MLKKLKWVICATTVTVSVTCAIEFGSKVEAQLVSEAPSFVIRGYTDAPNGVAVVAGDGIVAELRIEEGQQVKRGGPIAVLANFPILNADVLRAEAVLAQAQRNRDSLVSGYRLKEINEQEAQVAISRGQSQLKELELQRSSKPGDEKQLEIDIAKQTLEKDLAKLKMLRETLTSDLAQANSQIVIDQASLQNAITRRDESVVRSPLDGIVIQIWSHPGEKVGYQGIAKIVDMKQLCVVADLDETDIDRVAIGSEVKITFRDDRIFRGTLSRIAPAVKRMMALAPELSTATDARTVQIEISFDDLANVPQVLGRQAKIVFFK